MKAYKKIAKVIPIAVLSTSVLFAPVMAFAAETSKSSTVSSITNTVSPSELKQSFEAYLTNVAKYMENISLTDIDFKKLPGLKVGSFDGLNDDINYVYKGTASLELAGVAVGDGSPQTASLGEIHNTTDVEQTLKTESKSIATTKSFTVTDSEGLKITVGYEETLEVGIPLLADGKGTFKTSFEGNYQHTTADTLSKTETITFPSQDIKAIPHGTTRLGVTVYQQKFSGKDVESKVAPTGQMSFQNGKVKLNVYDAVKYAAAKIGKPDYIAFDDVNKQLLITKDIGVTFTGVAGYATKGEVTFVPDDPKQKTVKMSLDEYKDPQVRAKLLKQ
ncbi:TPA: ETX/MTX2 family pore-forming toxin [Bacillus cereus]